MPAYHSKISPSGKIVGNMALLTFRTKVRGPINNMNKNDLVDGDMDIIDEALMYFKANVFFKQFEIQSDSDRVLIYLTLYITECLKKLMKCTSKEQANQEMYSLAIKRFDIPGEQSFVLNSVYAKPASVEEADMLRQYLTQIRQECGNRVVDRVFDKETGKPSKWWLCFAKRRFMDISLSGHGQ